MRPIVVFALVFSTLSACAAPPQSVSEPPPRTAEEEARDGPRSHPGAQEPDAPEEEPTIPPDDARARAAELARAARHLVQVERLLERGPLLFLTEGTSAWEGQGASPRDPVRVRPYRRVEYLDLSTPRYARWRTSFFQDGEPFSCGHVVADADSEHFHDCVSGEVASDTSRNAGDQIRGWTNGFNAWGVLDRTAADTTARWIGRRSEGPRQSDVIAVGFVPEGHLHLDAETGRPRRLTWEARDALGRPVTRALEFDDYRSVDGTSIPYRRVYRNPGGNGFDERLVEVQTEAAPHPGLFDLPDDTPLVASGTGTGDSIRILAPGVVFARFPDVDYNVLLVETDGFLVALDAPVGPELADRILSVAETHFSGVPLRYVVSTHFHHDHVAGLGRTARAGVTVVTSPGDREFVSGLLPGAYASAGGPAAAHDRILVVREAITLGSDRNRIRILPVDGSPHVDEMLLPWLPGHDAVFVADLFWTETAGPLRPADRETDAFLRALNEHGLDPRLLVPSHGVLATMEDIRTMRRIRREMEFERLDPFIAVGRPGRVPADRAEGR